MMGVEMMLASMLGVSKEEMQETIGNAIELLGSLDGRFKEIERKQDLILSALNTSTETTILQRMVDDGK